MRSRDLNTIQAFVALGKTNSFTEAAALLGVPKSFISRKVAELEAHLKVRLVDRTTRTVALTEDGSQYYSTCEKALSDILEIEDVFDQGHSAPSGRLRITCPVEFGGIITQHLCKTFLKQYPLLQLEVLSTNGILDLVKDRVDVAIRPFQLADPSMKFVKVGQMEWGLYATPDWIKKNKVAKNNIDSLKNLDIIAFHPQATYQNKFKLILNKKEKQLQLEFNPKIITSSLTTLLEATLAGSGIAPLPDVLISQHMRAQKLVRVFPDWSYRKETLVAVFLNQKNTPARVRAFLDFLKQYPLLDFSDQPAGR